MFIKVRVAIDFTKIYQLKGLEPKNKEHTNFYEHCDLMKKVYLMVVHKCKSSEFMDNFTLKTSSHK